MKIVGSRAALMLARKKFGEETYVSREGKLFCVGVIRKNFLFPGTHHHCKGAGKSWGEALAAAGIPVVLDAKAEATVPEVEA